MLNIKKLMLLQEAELYRRYADFFTLVLGVAAYIFFEQILFHNASVTDATYSALGAILIYKFLSEIHINSELSRKQRDKITTFFWIVAIVILPILTYFNITSSGGLITFLALSTFLQAAKTVDILTGLVSKPRYFLPLSFLMFLVVSYFYPVSQWEFMVYLFLIIILIKVVRFYPEFYMEIEKKVASALQEHRDKIESIKRSKERIPGHPSPYIIRRKIYFTKNNGQLVDSNNIIIDLSDEINSANLLLRALPKLKEFDRQMKINAQLSIINLFIRKTVNALNTFLFSDNLSIDRAARFFVENKDQLPEKFRNEEYELFLTDLDAANLSVFIKETNYQLRDLFRSYFEVPSDYLIEQIGEVASEHLKTLEQGNHFENSAKRRWEVANVRYGEKLAHQRNFHMVLEGYNQYRKNLSELKNFALQTYLKIS